MPISMRLWQIDNDDLTPIDSRQLDREERLHRWLEKDISLVSDDLLVIGSHLASDLGGELDLLAIDREGDLAVLELKRDKTPRDVVAQALHYAAWVRTLTWDDIEEVAHEFLDGISIEDAFTARFDQPLPDTVNTNHRIYIVAAEMDDVSESIVRYLSEEYSAKINVVFFRYFPDVEGHQYLGRSWLMDPSEVEIRRGGGGTRRERLTDQELENQAESNGVAEQYRVLVSFFGEDSTNIRRTQSNISFAFPIDGKNRGIISLYPNESSTELGLYADVRPELIAETFDMTEDQVRTALTSARHTDETRYGEIYYFEDADDAESFVAALTAH